MEVNKVLYGLIGSKIAVVDVNTSMKAKKQCFREKCTTIIVAEKTDELMAAFSNGDDVTMDMFKGIEL